MGNLISYSCIFISYIQCFEVCFQNSGYFSKKIFFFLDFRLIQFDFRWIEILLKNFSEPLSGLIDRTCFLINWTSWIKFFFLKKKAQFWPVQTSFQNFSKVFFFLSPTRQGSTEMFFLSFSSKILAKFLSP